jgi:hypothetical protein
LTGTQPGQASNDIVTTALFLTAVALLFEGRLAPAPTAIAAIAAGIALGTKLTVATPVVVLTVGVVVLAIRARRPATAVAWCVFLGLSGGYWFTRNWIVAGNPLPWSEFSLGPLTVEAEINGRPGLVEVLDQGETWRRFIFPGFLDAIGPAWPVVLAIGIAGAVVGVANGRLPIHRVAGASALVGIVAFPFTPYTGDLGGGGFVFTVRYLIPELLVGLMLLTMAVTGTVVWRRALFAVLIVLVVLDLSTSYIEGIPSWPTDEVVVGVLAGLAAIGVAILILAPPGRNLVRWGAVGAVAGGLVAGGWLVQRAYFEHRYVDAGLPNDETNAFFQDLSDERVAVFGTEHFYPLFGIDLSNRVLRIASPDQSSAAQECRSWRAALGDFNYIVIGHQQFSEPGPDEAWIADDPATSPVLRDGDATVYRVDGILDPSGCT